jgi:hypothetical protein
MEEEKDWSIFEISRFEHITLGRGIFRVRFTPIQHGNETVVLLDPKYEPVEFTQGDFPPGFTETDFFDKAIELVRLERPSAE